MQKSVYFSLPLLLIFCVIGDANEGDVILQEDKFDQESIEETSSEIASADILSGAEMTLKSSIPASDAWERNSKSATQTLESPNLPLDYDPNKEQKLGIHWFFFGQGILPTIGFGARFRDSYPQHEFTLSSIMLVNRFSYNLIFPFGERGSWYFGTGVSLILTMPMVPPEMMIGGSLMIGYWGKVFFADLGIEPIYVTGFATGRKFFAPVPTIRMGFHF